MPQQKHNSEQLKAYREEAVKPHEFSLGVKQQLDKAGETGHLQDASASLSQLQARTDEFTKLRESLGPTGIFLAKYNVVVHDEHTVSFVLPKGCSRTEILQAAQGLVQDRDLICPGMLTVWAKDPKFNKDAEQSESICIDGHAKDSENKSRAEQESLIGKENVASFEDLAVAFAMHWIATGGPLFGWHDKSSHWSYVVRAVRGALQFEYRGLLGHGIYDDDRDSGVAAATRSPRRR